MSRLCGWYARSQAGIVVRRHWTGNVLPVSFPKTDRFQRSEGINRYESPAMFFRVSLAMASVASSSGEQARIVPVECVPYVIEREHVHARYLVIDRQRGSSSCRYGAVC